MLDEVHQTVRVVEHPVLNLVRRRRFRSLLLGILGRLGSVTDHLVGHLGIAHALIGELDGEALVEEGLLLQASRHRLEVVGGGLEDLRVRPETYGGTRLLGRCALLQGAWLGTRVDLLPLESVAQDLHLELGGKRVHHRDAHTVQTTGNRVRIRVELTSGM